MGAYAGVGTGCAPVVPYSPIGLILVLFILLVIISSPFFV